MKAEKMFNISKMDRGRINRSHVGTSMIYKVLLLALLQTKQEKLGYAVTSCFPSTVSETDTCNSPQIPDDVFVDK